jgi:hypothetical protein
VVTQVSSSFLNIREHSLHSRLDTQSHARSKIVAFVALTVLKIGKSTLRIVADVSLRPRCHATAT